VFPIVAGSVKEGKTIHASWSSELVLVSESVQCSSDSGNREVTSAIVLSVIVICCRSGIQSEPTSSYQSHYPLGIRDNIYIDRLFGLVARVPR
jgi:hypothetical protein